MEWNIARSGWVGERNFDVEIAQTEQGYVPRVRVYGFPVLEVPQAPYVTEELALQGALQRLTQEFDETPRLT